MQIIPNYVEINKTHPNENKQRLCKACYIAREAASIICLWQTPRQAGEWESFVVKTGRLWVCTHWSW